MRIMDEFLYKKGMCPEGIIRVSENIKLFPLHSSVTSERKSLIQFLL